ncbi:glycosyltransferase [Colwellia sp. Arc7-635]|uniref:glycosyltransferase family 4 protein n=1 Tax=Colwellia sp. Arc7-635 TaxID=2497879 RepID=UPI000F85715A|nr:glycosyltransferase [Colwellia sp. Arc7-635]AZQ85452.1 glycosyltransferase [Colwellia sp. Arc7-635]
MKLAVVYRVIQGWRVPVFERLSQDKDFKVFYGCDFQNTKVVSAKGPFNFTTKKLHSIPLAYKKTNGNMLLPVSLGLFFELVRFRPDVVLCEGASNFINNISIFLYCKLFRKKMIQWGLGEIRGRKKSSIRKYLDPFIIPIEKRADAIVAYSSEGSKYYKKIGIEEKNIFVAVNVVDTEKRQSEIEAFRKTHHNVHNSQVFKVLFVGALEPNKNIDMLINSFKSFNSLYRDTELHIVGGGSDKLRLEQYVRQNEMYDSVIFHGKVDGALINVVHDKDVFVMPGLGGLAVSDMLCHGIPVICGIGDGCEKDLINGKNGIIDDELNELKLFEYLKDLKMNPEKLKSMKVNASSTTEEHNISNYVQQINNAIEFVLEGKKN